MSGELLKRLYDAARDDEVEAICIGPETYYEIAAIVGYDPTPPIHALLRGGTFTVFGKKVEVINGIPPGEVVPSSYPSDRPLYKWDKWDGAWTLARARASIGDVT